MGEKEMNAFIFPGQGSQYHKMGKSIIDRFGNGSKYIDNAEKVLNMDISHLLFKADESELKDTENAQIAILLTSFLWFQYLKERGIYADFVAGHSLGEYSALLCADSISFDDALLLVRERAITMKRFTALIKGGQGAILNIPIKTIEDILSDFKEEGFVSIACYNSKSQIVVSGEERALAEIQKIVKKNRGKYIHLKTSLPFHSPFMERAENEFKYYLQNVEFRSPLLTFVSSVTNEPVSSPDEIKETLYSQMTSPVRWIQTISRIMKFGVHDFYEVGPGKVLTNLGRSDFKELAFYNVESLD